MDVSERLTRWGTPKEYASYFGMLLTNSGRREFRWWLERENAALYRLFLKEAKIDDRPIPPSPSRTSGAAEPRDSQAAFDAPEVSALGDEVLAGGA